MPSKKIVQKVTLEHSHLPPSPHSLNGKRNWDIKNCSLTPSLLLAIGTNYFFLEVWQNCEDQGKLKSTTLLQTETQKGTCDM